MIIQHEYSRLKRTTYKFTKRDIVDALCKATRIDLGEEWELEVFEETQMDSGRQPYIAILTLNHKEKENPS